MYLSRHRAARGPRWALDGRYLPQDFTLDEFSEIGLGSPRCLEGQHPRRLPETRSCAGRARARGMGQRGYVPAKPGGARVRVG